MHRDFGRRGVAHPTMKFGDKTARIMAILHEGPATTREIADATGWPSNYVAALLAALRGAGRVERRPFKPPNRPESWLWSVEEIIGVA